MRAVPCASPGSLRYDGRVLAAGSLNVIKAFDVNRGAMMRLFKGHTAAVNVVQFARGQGSLQLVSGADDATVRHWDLPTGNEVGCLLGHTDYVRCAANSAMSAQVWATGLSLIVLVVPDSR